MNQEKVNSALHHIRRAFDLFGKAMFTGHSGGKDSVVIHHLTKQIVQDFVTVHNVKPMLGTSGDPVAALTEQHPKTLLFLYEYVTKHHPVVFMHSSFMPEYVKNNNLKCQIDGARISEAGRAGKSSNFVMNGETHNRKDLVPLVAGGLFGIHFCYPILDWTDDDVFDYIFENQLHLSEEYFDNGEVQAYKERRNNA